MLLKIIILLLLHKCNSQLNVFEIDYLGNQLSVEEFKKLDVCYSRICMRDAKKIIAKASHRNDSEPCLDFDEFACGHFNAYKPPSERYKYVGFVNDFEVQKNDFMRKVLRQKIEEDEPKIFKVVKKFYQKCVNSTYVRTEGKAEFKSLLDEFGKFPIFEDNWKPSDFNVTNALILDKGYLFKCSHEDSIGCDQIIDQEYLKKEKIRNALKFDFYLSGELTSEITNDFFELYNKGSDGSERHDFVTIHKLDEIMNITSGLDWLEIMKHRYNDNDINNDALLLIKGNPNDFRMFDLKNRRKLANFFTIRFLLPKIDYFAVYPVPDRLIRSENRYEICIKEMRTFVRNPLEIMFQLKYGNETVSKAFKEFIEKFISIESSNLNGEYYYSHYRLKNLTIIVGYPDELTSPEFINKLYANLTLTGDEGLYKMSLKLKEFDVFINQEGKSLAVESLSENAKEIFKTCGKSFLHRKEEYCIGLNEAIVLKVENTLYPRFHPQRPYYVNLAYFSFYSYVLRLNEDFIDFGKHYLEYVEKFGPEQNLPGFLMTNEQMLQVINYQTHCYKNQKGSNGEKYGGANGIFNCSAILEKEYEEWEEEKDEKEEEVE